MILFITIFLLLHIAYQDLKERSVFLISFGLLLAAGLLMKLLYMEMPIAFLSIFINAAVVACVVLLLYLYVKYKMGLHFRDSIGLGDIFLWIVMAVAFSVKTFIWFFCGSMIFSLVAAWIFFRREKNAIPLAGLQSIFLSGVLLCYYFFYRLEILYQ